MQTSARKEDRRVRRTKRLLTQALVQLMQEKTVKDITVKELTELADMNRGTFYLYYKDIHDMLRQVEDNLFSLLEGLLDKHKDDGAQTDITSILEDIFTFASENADLCRVLLSRNGDITFLMRMNQLLKEKCKIYWDAVNADHDDDEYDYCFNFCVCGCAGLLFAWLGKNCAEAPAQMARIASDMLIRGSLSSAEAGGN